MRLRIASIIGAIIAGVACVAPAILLLFMGGGALAFIPPWADFIILPLFIGLSGLAFFLWHREKKIQPATTE